jgi:hypothetical protein
VAYIVHDHRDIRRRRAREHVPGVLLVVGDVDGRVRAPACLTARLRPVQQLPDERRLPCAGAPAREDPERFVSCPGAAFGHQARDLRPFPTGQFSASLEELLKTVRRG